MSEIFGCSLKSVKKTYGYEGEGFIANLCIDGKKAGTVADYGDGGCMDINLDGREVSEILNERRKKYFEKFPVSNEPFKVICDNTGIETKMDNPFENNETFISDIYDLYEKEKFFKKNFKKGFSVMVTTDYPINVEGPTPVPTMTCFGGKEPEKLADKFIKEQKEKCDSVIIGMYKSLSDFVVL